MKITVVGIGYVGLSIAVLLAQRHQVAALDIDAARVAALNAGQAPLRDSGIEAMLKEGALDLRATTDPREAMEGADFVVIATPTSYDPQTNRFATGSVEEVAQTALRLAPEAAIVIKSTVPMGFTEALNARLGTDRIIFSPEFLREGQALHDNLYPSRIVMGSDSKAAARFAALLSEAALAPDVPVLLCRAREAEAIKLFANTYLALRVAFFNELDSYAMAHGLQTRDIVTGVCMDPRIGSHYNNPSFGYGGYCLPKDTKQLLANYEQVPQNLIRAVIEANTTRMDFIADTLLARKPARIGIHRLVMKSGSDNFRASAIGGVIERLRASGVPLAIHEPTLDCAEYHGIPVIADLDAFKRDCDLIVANRMAPELRDVAGKVFTRDLFGEN